MIDNHFIDRRSRIAILVFTAPIFGMALTGILSGICIWGMVLLSQNSSLSELVVMFFISLIGLSFFGAFLVYLLDVFKTAKEVSLKSNVIEIITFSCVKKIKKYQSVKGVERLDITFPRSTLTILDRSSKENYKLTFGDESFYLSAHIKGLENLISQLLEKSAAAVNHRPS